MRDDQRSAVYAAEDHLGRLFADSAAGAHVDFFGSSLALPIERHFADVASIQRYCDAVLAMPAVADVWPDMPPVSVRERKGQSKAHYDYSTHTIAMPMQRRWALRELVVLHELAHHCASCLPGLGGETRHGPIFTGVFLYLIEQAIGPESALLLRAGFDQLSVRVTPVHLLAKGDS